MESGDRAVPKGQLRKWTGRLLSGLTAAFLTFDAVIKLVKIQPVVGASSRLGYPDIAVPLGIVLLACVAIYLVPKTSLVCAILFTGYLGGALATHVRVADPCI